MKEIEDRIFELTGDEPVGRKVVARVVEEFGADRDLVWDLYLKVRYERGTPNRVATREAIEQYRKVNFI